MKEPVDISIPTALRSHLDHLTEASLSKIQGDAATVNEYLHSMLEAGRLTMTNDVLSCMDSTDVGGIEYDGSILRTVAHSPSDVSGKTVTGRAAVIRAQARIGGGVPVPVMLPHTGIWITLLPPSEGELLDLWRSMVNDKISLGRFTYGAIYSATSIVTQRRMIDFCLNHVEAMSVSLKDTSLVLKDIILITDLPFLLNGMGIAVHPRGIQYDAPCVVDPSSCSHVTTGKLYPDTLAWYNGDAIPTAVKPTLASRSPDSVTVADCTAYRNAVAGSFTASLVDETGLPIEIRFTVPTLSKAITLGERWLHDVHDSVATALLMDKPADEEEWSERNLHITQMGKTSFLRQYGAWVTRIDLHEAGVIEDNDSDIADVLTVLSGADKVRADMTEAVEKYIRHASIGGIGVPIHPCPSCGRTPPTPEGRASNIIAVDPIRLFFKFLVARVDRIQKRSLQ